MPSATARPITIPCRWCFRGARAFGFGMSRAASTSTACRLIRRSIRDTAIRRSSRRLKEQADRITLTSRAFHNDQMGGFLKDLCEVTEMEMALPMNTGAEAVETAIKMARKWGYQKRGIPEGKAEIVVCNNNFHGRTTTIVGFSSEPQYRDGFGPFTPGFKLIDFGDTEAARAAMNENTVAFLVEPIQGEAGVLVPPPGFLAEARKICSERNALFMLDEIQTGLGRTGRLFCYQHERERQTRRPHSRQSSGRRRLPGIGGCFVEGSARRFQAWRSRQHVRRKSAGLGRGNCVA